MLKTRLVDYQDAMIYNATNENIMPALKESPWP